MDDSKSSTCTLPGYRTVNVIVSTRADRELSLEILAEKLSGCVYEPEIFPGLVYRRSDPKATIIAFATGKITSVGSKSEEAARMSIVTTVSEIARIEGEINVGNITTENVVATVDVGRQIDIDKVSGCVLKTIYEPEQFPGVIHRPKDNVVVIIFKSGKLVTTGSKSENEAKSTLCAASKTLKECGCLIEKT